MPGLPRNKAYGIIGHDAQPLRQVADGAGQALKCMAFSPNERIAARLDLRLRGEIRDHVGNFA